MLKLRLKSFRYATNGLLDLVKTQPNAQIHLLITVLVLIAGFYLKITALEWCILLLTIALVFAAEALNTALEYLTNLVSPGHHPLAGKAKDAAAGAVLVAAFFAVIIGVIVFLPKIIQLF